MEARHVSEVQKHKVDEPEENEEDYRIFFLRRERVVL